jgi:NAD(P)-dependent dehydrogenase (short-subunit alcohol dehydrogenase family)
MASVETLFRLDDRVAVITGGAGLLGYQHAATIAGLGGLPVLLDINTAELAKNADRLEAETGCKALTLVADITDVDALRSAQEQLQAHHGRLDILINNAARNPKVENAGG